MVAGMHERNARSENVGYVGFDLLGIEYFGRLHRRILKLIFFLSIYMFKKTLVGIFDFSHNRNIYIVLLVDCVYEKKL